MDNKIRKLLLLILIIVSLSSCGKCKYNDAKYFETYNFKALDYVDLCGYENINVNSEYVEVSDSDVVTVIEMDMEYYDCMKSVELEYPKEDYYVLLRIVNVENNQSSDVYYLIGSDDFGSHFESILKKTDIKESFIAEIDGVESKIINMGYFEPATIEDENIILNFYELKTMDEVYEYIRNKTRTNIIFYYMMDIILENTVIKDLPSVVGNYYDEYSASFWNDIIIYKAILEKEDKELTVSEFEQALEKTARENETTCSAVLEENADYVLHFVLEQKVKNILVDYIDVY